MRLIYSKNGFLYSTCVTNADVEIIETTIDRRKTVIAKAKVPISLEKASHMPHGSLDENGIFFLNGYQSWTDTKETLMTEIEKNIYRSPGFIVNKFAMDKYGDATFYDYDKNILHGYDVFYAKGLKESFIYSVNFKNAYLIIEVRKKSKKVHLISDVSGKNLAEGESFTLFDYYLFDDFDEGMRSFETTFPKRDLPKIFGYTSWYNYYQNIDEATLLRDLDALDDRFDLFQIDDGYESFVGDWLTVDQKKFPNGLVPIVEKIHARGFKAGIWMAPFAVEEKSALFAEHRDWLKVGEDGKLLKCGGNWSGFYTLDLDNKEAVEYIKKCLLHYADLGFDFFKLDFLYAAALPPYGGRTRCMVQEAAYALLRETLGDKIILGCGANLANACGKFDYMRVGPDVSLKFDDAWFMRFFHRERISTKVTLQNTIYRSFLDGRFFGNDPDVFLLRKENISLSDDQKRALATINALFGSVLMTSDNIAAYDEKEAEMLSRTLDLFRRGKVLFFARIGEDIEFAFETDGIQKQLVYNTKKGIFVNER